MSLSHGAVGCLVLVYPGYVFFTIWLIIEPLNKIYNNVVFRTSKGSADQPAHKHSLIRAFSILLNIIGLFSYCPNSL